MNRKRESYDRYAVGERIKKKRMLLGMSQDELGEKIDRATKYCSDIERGMCGMSIETMIAISKSLDITLDYLVFGEEDEIENSRQEQSEIALIHAISKCPEQKRMYAIRMLQIFLSAMDINNDK
ncbi:MAG: helix-turn-helix transcriptional regulator [Agathobacter sp.]|nr:helix-turn-helix transcriptional regulator [Agathobacter sp.]